MKYSKEIVESIKKELQVGGHYHIYTKGWHLPTEITVLEISKNKDQVLYTYGHLNYNNYIYYSNIGWRRLPFLGTCSCLDIVRKLDSGTRRKLARKEYEIQKKKEVVEYLKRYRKIKVPIHEWSVYDLMSFLYKYLDELPVTLEELHKYSYYLDNKKDFS